MATELAEALELIAAHPGEADFVGPRPEDVVAAAEERLDVHFPPSYRTFLLKLGMGSFGGEEFLGVLDTDFKPVWPGLVGLCLQDRENGMPARYLPVYSWGDGTTSAIDLDRPDEQGECPVVACHDGLFLTAPIEEEAPTFGAFLLARVREALAGRTV